MSKHFSILLSLGLVAGIGACVENGPTPPATFESTPGVGPLSVTAGDGMLEREEFELCKIGGPTAGTTFAVEVRDEATNTLKANFDVTLNDGECAVVWIKAFSNDLVTVEESIPSGFDTPTWRLEQLVGSSVTLTTGAGTNVYGSVGGSGGDGTVEGALLTYTNTPGEVNGRMTGGGNQIRIDGVRITRGFTLHCDILLSNNIEVNWPGGNKWHLDKPITKATCIDDPQYDEEQPPAPFNTFIGEGFGQLNGQGGSFIRFVFIDDGEPGVSDRATIDIWAPGADPTTDTPQLHVDGVLDHGNIQAHFDQPHRNRN